MTTAPALSMLDQVLALAERGWKLFPVYEPAGDGCACGEASCNRVAKHPRTEHGLKDASSDPAQIRRWWTRWPGANVAVATGASSGLFVVDVDGPAGDLALRALELRHGPLPATLTATSGRVDGGRHLYFRHPGAGRHVTTRRDAIGPSVDVRGDGGYVVIPPSTHASGRSYVWVGAAEPAEAPEWLTRAVLRQAAPPVPRPPLQVVRDPASAYERARAYVARMAPAVSGSGGHDATFRAALAVVRGFSLSEADAFELLWTEYNPRCDPPWTERELRHKVTSAARDASVTWGYLLEAERPQARTARPPEPPPLGDAASPYAAPGSPWDAETPSPPPPRGRRDQGGTGEPPEDDRPVIQITTEEHEVNAEAVRSLTRDASLFQRAGMLVHVVRDPEAGRAKVARPPDAPRIVPLPAAVLREKLTRCARWEKWSKTEKAWQPAHPPEWTIAATHTRGEWTGVRPIDGIVETPVFRRDGTILDRPGYDAATRLVFEPTEEFLPVPENPTRDDAVRAASELLEVVCDFPFASSEHAAAWAAGLLTPLARAAFMGPAPMFVADANAPASGKTLLMDAIAAVAQGREFSRTTNCASDEEWKKQITSIALAGDPMVLIDNVSGGLGSASLDAALTGSTWSDRILGKNEKPSLRLTTLWYASANNVVLKGDLFRRVLQIRLNCLDEHPESRTDFHHPDLLGWIRRERPRLVRAALTILRAYHVAGRPDMGVSPWGSYEEWVRLVPHALVFAGFADPTRTRQSFADAAATEVGALRGLVLGLAGMGLPSSGYTVREILLKLERDSGNADFNGQPDPHAELRAALDELAPAQPGKPYDARKVGKQLQKYRGRVVAGQYVERVGETRDSAARWAVLSVAGSAGSA